MDKSSDKPIKMKVFPKGQVVIPVSLRKKYKIDINDLVNVISTPEGILLKPISKKQTAGSLTSQLSGIFCDYSTRQAGPGKADIEEATEAGFIEGWNK